MAKPKIVEDIEIKCGECSKTYMTYRFSTENQIVCPRCRKRVKKRFEDTP